MKLPTFDLVPVLTGRRPTLAVFAVASALALVLVLQPIGSGLLRRTLVAALTLAQLCLVRLLWSSFHLGKVLGLAVSVTCALVILAEMPAEETLPRDLLVERLRSFEGSRYVWGGECGRGIDCSGLVRRGMIESTLQAAWQETSPGRLRQALAIWWSDASARHMGAGYDGRFEPILEDRRVRELEDHEVEPGDLAVTLDGRHVMAALGDGRWIQAEPRAGRVVINDRRDDLHWFRTPVRVLRWRALSPS